MDNNVMLVTLTKQTADEISNMILMDEAEYAKTYNIQKERVVQSKLERVYTMIYTLRFFINNAGSEVPAMPEVPQMIPEQATAEAVEEATENK